ncbi:survival of motor neuron-related-splicing factor 30-like isoform X2 [Littorina saxatilis]|uniref:survival of motor neuron-related-splicing factor 30-like isoform X2 n=1 Tax=Littorina saxatilis TaxID=31220 RepID=UPI0038B58498
MYAGRSHKAPLLCVCCSGLLEVIDLTQELISGKGGAGGGGGAASSGDAYGAAASTSAETGEEEPAYSWNVGDQCMAVYSEDSMHYEATIEEILDDGACTVTFNEYGNTDVTQVTLLKPVDTDRKRGADSAGGPDSKKIKSKKDLLADQREYKRKKSQKKAQRLKQMTEERETEKNKWLDFNSKTFAKTSKGKVKKSIFATPDGTPGRVGVGTCGVSGKPMTAYQVQEKWKK